MAFKLLPPVPTEDIHHGCLNCGGTAQIAPMDTLVAVGFGYAAITKDGEVIYQEPANSEVEDPTLQKFEDMAKLDPDHDWQLTKVSPLRDSKYQRQGEAHWVLIESGMGFA